MKRNWQVIRIILEHIEAEDLPEYIRGNAYLQDVENADELLGHIEILIEAGILHHCEVLRNKQGEFAFWDFRGAYMTMQGHDLLETLRSKTLWNKIRAKAAACGMSLSWEFVKQAIPLAIKETLNG